MFTRFVCWKLVWFWLQIIHFCVWPFRDTSSCYFYCCVNLRFLYNPSVHLPRLLPATRTIFQLRIYHVDKERIPFFWQQLRSLIFRKSIPIAAVLNSVRCKSKFQYSFILNWSFLGDYNLDVCHLWKCRRIHVF